MTSTLIAKCYENEYGIDLKSFHQKICSNKDQIDEGAIKKLNLKRRFIFNDGISNYFDLKVYNNLVYLVGENSCYPCGTPVKSAYGEEYNFVPCYIIPNKRKIIGESDIRKSSIIVSFFHELIPLVKDQFSFINLINDLRYAFSDCTWFKAIFSLSTFIHLSNFWDFKEKINQLYASGLLYPLEFSIYNIYNGVKFKNQHFLKYFLLSLSESTSLILDKEEIENFLNTLSDQQVEKIFLVDEIKKFIRIDLLDDNYFADLLGIDGDKRYKEFVNGKYWLDHMRDMATKIFIDSDFKKIYIKELKTNFRVIENELRKSKGYEEVGTFFMEKLLYQAIKKEFPQLTILSQYSPKWLFPQRFDIFIKELQTAVEYNGIQHYIAVEYFGGEQGLEYTKLLDELKKEKCDKYSVDLIVIRYDEDFDEAIQKLKILIETSL